MYAGHSVALVLTANDLSSNTPLYIQLLLGTYLTKNNFSNFLRLDSCLKLFKEGTDFEEYRKLVDKLGLLNKLNILEKTAMLTYIIFCSQAMSSYSLPTMIGWRRFGC